ncbi:MAG TPA: hypothetical protein VF827_09055 [Syntrophales bacterium]
MGQPRKESSGKKGPSAKSLSELMELLLKLNAQLREKVSPRRKKDEPGAQNMEMVIIILNSSPSGQRKAARTEKPKPAKDDWIEDLFSEIERGSGGPRNSA